MDAARQPRNHVVDTARAFSVFVVVVFHSLLYQVRVTDGFPVLVGWAPPHWPWWFLSWFFMIIPVFFFAGGFAHALVVDRMHREGTSYGHFLANRGRRLVGPLVFFITVIALVSTVIAWAGQLEAASSLTAHLMQLLCRFVRLCLLKVVQGGADQHKERDHDGTRTTFGHAGDDGKSDEQNRKRVREDAQQSPERRNALFFGDVIVAVLFQARLDFGVGESGRAGTQLFHEDTGFRVCRLDEATQNGGVCLVALPLKARVLDDGEAHESIPRRMQDAASPIGEVTVVVVQSE